jgi:hypothetical protein
MTPVDEFLKRLPASAETEREMVSTAFAIGSNFRQRADEIRSDRRLSDAAKAEDIKAAARASFGQHLKQIRSRAAAMNADLANLRKGFEPKAPDRSDICAELQRQELRAHLRALPEHERLRLAMNDDVVAEAVLHGHPALSGMNVPLDEGSAVDEGHRSAIEARYAGGENMKSLEQEFGEDTVRLVLFAHDNASPAPPSKYDLVKSVYLERKFGQQMRGVEARQEVLDNVNAAIEIATREFIRESQLSERDLETAA